MLAHTVFRYRIRNINIIMAAQCQWPMRSFWVTGVVTDHNLLHSEPGTTQMSLMLNLVTSTKAHEYAASLGLIDNMKVCDKCDSI